MLTSQQVEEFNEYGILKLAKCIDKDIAFQLTDRLWAFLESERGISRDDRRTWPLDYRPTGFQRLSRSGTFDRMAQPSLCRAIDSLLGQGASISKNWGIPLVVFPNSERSQWTIPFGKDTWHIDALPRDSSCHGIRAFLLLQDVAKHQGPTLAVSGSSKLLRKMPVQQTTKPNSKAILKKLSKSEPWIARLMSEQNTIEREKLCSCGRTTAGLPVKVAKFHGGIGDIFLMDISTIHTKSSNISAHPRMIVSQTFWTC